MEKQKFYPMWIALILVIVLIIQSFFPAFTEILILNENSWTQPWRFLTAIFLHGGLIHLLYNIIALVIFGLALEKSIGSKKFLAVFLVSGILANLISINFYSSSLGASGAIMGVIGALTIISPLMLVWAFGMILPMIVAAIVYIVIDSIGIFIPSNVGHIAHLSGIFFGMVFGIIFRVNQKKDKEKTHKIHVPEHILRRWETLYMRTD